MPTRLNLKAALDVAASFAMIGAAIFLVVRFSGAGQSRMPPPKLPEQPLSLAGAPTKGSHSARVAMVVYSDFQCPFCGALARDILPGLVTEFVDSGKVLLVFRHFPLPNHPRGKVAAQVASCAQTEGRFWEFHDRLFVKNGDLSDSGLQTSWNAVGLNPTAFSPCTLDGEREKQIDGEVAGARELDISTTPTAFIGRLTESGQLKVSHRVRGAQPSSDFVAALTAALSAK